MRKYLLLILSMGFWGCEDSGDNIQEPSELLVGIWKRNTIEYYADSLCSGNPIQTSNVDNYYIITKDTFSNDIRYESDCIVTSSEYSWNDDGEFGYLTFPNDSLIVDVIIATINDTIMIIDYVNAEANTCSKGYHIKVSSVEGCPDL